MGLNNPDMVAARSYYLDLLYECYDIADRRCTLLSVLALLEPFVLLAIVVALCLYFQPDSYALCTILICTLLLAGCPCGWLIKRADMLAMKRDMFRKRSTREHSRPCWNLRLYYARHSTLCAYKKRYLSPLRGYFG